MIEIFSSPTKKGYTFFFMSVSQYLKGKLAEDFPESDPGYIEEVYEGARKHSIAEKWGRGIFDTPNNSPFTSNESVGRLVTPVRELPIKPNPSHQMTQLLNVGARPEYEKVVCTAMMTAATNAARNHGAIQTIPLTSAFTRPSPDKWLVKTRRASPVRVQQELACPTTAYQSSPIFLQEREVR